MPSAFGSNRPVRQSVRDAKTRAPIHHLLSTQELHIVGLLRAEHFESFIYLTYSL